MADTRISFWQRPEGTTGKIILGGLFAVGAWAFIHFEVLTFLIALTTDMLHLAFLGGALALIAYTVLAERPRTLLFYVFQMFSRAITSMIVNIDPVSILEAFVKDMERKRETVQTAITAIMGVRQKMVKAKQQTEAELQQLARLAEVAKEPEQIAELENKAGRRSHKLEAYDANIQSTTETLEALQRVDRVIVFHINNSKDEAQQLKSDNEMALSMLAATHAASEALGGTDKLAVRDMAIDVIRDRVAKASGEVESLLESTRSVQGEIDLNNLAFSAEGRDKLNSLRKQLTQVDGPENVKQLSPGTGGARPIVQSENSWAQRLNKKSS